MDQQFDFRALLVKLQDCLSDNDRRRLHFIVGDTIPRHLRDDPTLGGTLSLLESLFDRAKISEQDFDYLIHAFEEIRCYDAVKRLKEHQLTQRQRNRCETTSTNVSDLLEDNEVDKISPNQLYSDFTSSNSSGVRDSTSTQATIISLEKSDIKKDTICIIETPIQSDNKESKVTKTIFRSRLTFYQLLILILTLISIVVFIVLIIVFVKIKHPKLDMLLIKAGFFYGNTAGGYDINDAQDCLLTFNDKIITISAGWTSDTLDYVTFYYSNGKSNKYGEQTYRYSPYMDHFTLDSDENINGVTVYTGTRIINNPYSPNGTYLVVGLRFYTTKGQTSHLFGSSNGTQANEILEDFIIGYARGRAEGYVDALQFIWYRKTAPTSSALLSTY